VLSCYGRAGDDYTVTVKVTDWKGRSTTRRVAVAVIGEPTSASDTGCPSGEDPGGDDPGGIVLPPDNDPPPDSTWWDPPPSQPPPGSPGMPGGGGGSSFSQVPRSGDPNDKVAPAGMGPLAMVTSESLFAYQIRFENLPEATAPAQDIRVSDLLDPHLDATTAELTEVEFEGQVIAIPPGLKRYEATVPLHGGTNDLLAGVRAEIDVAAGRLDVSLTYWFICVARDLAGNAEPRPGQADVTVRIPVPSPVIQSVVVESDGRVRIHATGSAGISFSVEASEDLIEWREIGTVTATQEGMMEFVDADAPSLDQRYYRLRWR